MTSEFADMTSSSIFVTFFVSLIKFSYWSKFQANIVTGSGIMTISFYKGLNRNTEIGYIPVWVLPNIWRLEWFENTKFGRNDSIKILLNAAKYQGYKFYRCGVIKGKSTGSKITPTPPISEFFWSFRGYRDILIFSGGIERDQWHEIGWEKSAVSSFLKRTQNQVKKMMRRKRTIIMRRNHEFGTEKRMLGNVDFLKINRL